LKADCSDTGTTTTIKASPYTSCAGSNNYVSVDVSLGDPTCKSAVTVYAGLGACVFEGTSFSQVYCDSKGATVQFYTPYFIPTSSMGPVTVEPVTSSSSMMPESSSSMMAESSSSMMAESSSSSMIEETTSSVAPTIEYCDSNLLCAVWMFSGTDSSCQLAGELNGIKVYGSQGNCDTSVTNNGKKKSASSLVAVINLVVGFVVALFSLF